MYMDFNTAKRKVKDLFSDYNKNKSNSIYNMLKENEVVQIYNALSNKLPKKDHKFKQAFIYFIYFTSIKFDRFNNLRPIDTEELFRKYQTMLSCLRKLEPVAYLYSWYMMMNIIRWEVYRKCANKAYNIEIETFLNEKVTALNKIKVREVTQQSAANIELIRKKIIEFINGFKSGYITNVRTELPYKLIHKNSTFHFYIDGIEVDASIENKLTGSPLPSLKFSQDATLDEMVLSKNSYSQSILTLQFHCFIDTGINLESISYPNKEEFSWNYLFDFTYKAIRSIWNHLQSIGDDFVTWPPLPQDIGSIDWSIASSQSVYDSGTFTNPATGFRISSNKRGGCHYEFNDESQMLWSDNAYYYARLYAKAGQFEETIFWINVSVESLIDEFLRQISPDSAIYEKLSNQESKFQSAEEILAEQYPDMEGKVTWPNLLIPASVFTKLKRALEYLKQSKEQTKEITRHYSLISKKRNQLFHGGSHDIQAKDIDCVFESYHKLKSFFSQCITIDRTIIS